MLALLFAIGCAGNADDGGMDALIMDVPMDAGQNGPGIRGVLEDEDEDPLKAMVLACLATTCYFGESDDQGRFYFMIEPPAEIALKTLEDLDATPRRGATLAPVKLTDRSLIDVGTVYTPHLPAGTPLGPASSDPQALAAGDGLELTLNRADLRPRLGDTLFDVAARAIPEPHIPPIPDLGSEQIIAVYAIHPFGAHSSSPIAVKAPSTVAAGTTVYFRSISELDGLLSPPATGLADGAFVATAAGQGITELSWLIISR